MASLANKIAANKRFEFTSAGFDADKFAVVTMRGFEAISKPFRFELTLVSDDPSIDFDKALQNTATLKIFAPDGASSTPYHGVVAEFDQLQQSDGYVFYRAVLVPKLWRLSLYEMSEVYLNDQSIPQIVEKVLKESRLSSADYELKLSGSYRARSFVCQYQETSLDFIARWMEKEGMYFYFDQDGQTEKLVIADNRSMHAAQALKVLYRPANEKDTGAAADSVQDFVCRQKPLPQAVQLRDFNHRKASVELKVRETVSENGVGEINLYGENFRNEDEGRRYAKLRAEEIRCGGKVFMGEATAVGLRSGYFMELARHYRDNFNGQYLVTEVQHEGSQAAALLAGIQTTYSDGFGETNYRSTFRAIPAAVQFRPERTTPRPRVSGTMNAIIDAEGSGEYAELDEYGQYKVQLPFDSSDKDAGKGSARVRMASPYSGSDHGMNFPLQKQAEVLLSFIDGNPDEPVIMGAVPNSDNPSLVNQNNPYENKITTKGGNLMHMGDQAGKEVMWLHSPFHNSTIGLGSIDPKGGGSLWQSTGGSSETVTVGTKNDLFLGFKNSASLSLENSFSAGLTNKMTIGSTVSVGVGFDVSWKMGKSVEFDDSTKYSLKSDAKLQGAEKVLISGGQRMAVKAAVDVAKTVLRVAVGTSMALNAAAAAGAGNYISLAADETGNKDKDGKYIGKTKPWDNGGHVNAAREIAGAAGVVTAGAVAATMIAAGRTFAAVGSPKSVYASNINVDDSGIDLGVDDVSLVNKGNIAIKNSSVSVVVKGVTSPLGSSIGVATDAIVMKARNLAGLGGSTTLHDGVTVATTNLAGEIELSHPVGGNVKLSGTGLAATTGASKLELKVVGGATLTGSPAAKLDLSPTMLEADGAGSKLLLNVVGCRLKSATGGAVFVGARVAITGPLIQLG